MKMKSTPFKQVNRDYLVTSAEIKKALEIKGDITSISLSAGRSQEDIEKGVSADRDEWSITTEEIKPQTTDSKKES
jgi:nitrogen fixation/metabolism regulation signal transduction histidine kinase